MRILQRYKKYSKNFFPLFSLPKEKILKFHRPKWKKVQKILLKKEKKIVFKNHSIVHNCLKRWDRQRSFFRTKLNLKKSFQNIFFNAVDNIYLKKLFINKKFKTYSQIVQDSLFKTEYRIDILLWRLNFFRSWFLTGNEIKNNIVLLNNRKLTFIHFLKCGDIVYIPRCLLIKFLKKSTRPAIMYTFIEVDYYTNTIIIIKDLKYLNKKDFFLLTRYLYNVLDLKDYMLK